MMGIGEFARLGGVSVRMLRHYDRIGLLVPAHVDERTGRRSYDRDQLARLNRIVALKGLGFTLEQVADLLRAGVTAEELHGMLRLRRAELERQVHRDRHALDRVLARLRLIEGEEPTPDQVVTKHAEPLRLAALSSSAPRADRGTVAALVEALFIRTSDLMDAAGADRTTPVARLVPETKAGEDVRVTTGFVLPRGVVPGLQVVHLPPAQVATTIHRGPMDGIGASFQTLAHWSQAHGHADALHTARWRELFLEADGDDQGEWIVELQLELAPP